MRATSYKTLTRPQAKTLSQDSLLVMIILVAIHVGLAMLFRSVRILSTIHAIVVFILGFWTALTSDDIKRVIPYAAYISGVEILWRMTKASVFWEFGKYAVVVILLVSLLRQHKKLKNLRLTLLFFALFLPSIYLTIDSQGFSRLTADLISFNLSGPLAATLCILFFSQVELDDKTLKRSIWAAVYPIVGVLTLAIYSTMTATKIDFGSESNFITSAGYGPNQVSAILGLGAMLLILYSILMPREKGRLMAIALSLILIAQSFLTFSRGGIYNIAVALGLAFLVLLRRPNKGIRAFLILLVILFVIGFFVFPRLEALTGGALSERYSDIDPITRIGLAESDFKLFLSHPIAGVGVGMSSYLRGGLLGIASHTEYSRILAEHGILGILALLILAGMLLRSFLQAPNPTAQAWIVACAAWAGVEMSHSAMRFVAVSFILGLAFATYKQEETPQSDEETASYRYHRFRKYPIRHEIK